MAKKDFKILGVIPARYASSRFPGKPLASIGNKTMVQTVYAQASKARMLDAVYVATDHPLIEAHIKGFGGNVMMTSEEHRNGTERIYELVARLPEKYDAIVNIQGDEPFVSPDQIDLLCESIMPDGIDIATLAKKITRKEELYSHDTVKVVFNKRSLAMYFSRQPIPYLRSVADKDWVQAFDFFKHIGMYAFKTPVLRDIVRLPGGRYEKAESLEQLRWLEESYNIFVRETRVDSFGIDRPEDIAKALDKI
jgi:3-deoxy-manno-octulosonate cytidylyltransferase (CMP-KDO synthetase)